MGYACPIPLRTVGTSNPMLKVYSITSGPTSIWPSFKDLSSAGPEFHEEHLAAQHSAGGITI